MKLNIEIDMATLGFEQDAETGDLYPTDDLIGRVAEIIANRAIRTSEVRSIAESEVRNVASSQAEDVVAEVLSGPIQRTDVWGEPKGETTSVKSMVLDEVQKWMTLPTRDSYHGNPNMADSLKKIIDEILRSEMKSTIDEAKRKVHEEVLKLAVEGAVEALAKARVI